MEQSEKINDSVIIGSLQMCKKRESEIKMIRFPSRLLMAASSGLSE